MMNLIRNLFTEDDGVSWCVGRVIGALAFIELSAQFFRVPIDQIAGNLQSYCIGVAALIAAVAAKNFSERK